MEENPESRKLEADLLAGRLDDILARIDAEYASYKQIPVFTCAEEELAFWSRTAPAPVDDASLPDNGNPD